MLAVERGELDLRIHQATVGNNSLLGFDLYEHNTDRHE